MGLLDLFRTRIPAPEVWPEDVVELSGEGLDGFVTGYPFVFVDFWADWCKPCRRMKGRVAELAERYQGRVAVAKLDTQRYQEISKRMGISSLPSMVMWKHGRRVDRRIGECSFRDLERMVKKHLD